MGQGSGISGFSRWCNGVEADVISDELES